MLSEHGALDDHGVFLQVGGELDFRDDSRECRSDRFLIQEGQQKSFEIHPPGCGNICCKSFIYFLGASINQISSGRIYQVWDIPRVPYGHLYKKHHNCLILDGP